MRKNLGLYIHIPFCERKCRYCGFLSFAGCSDEVFERYEGALLREIEGYAVLSSDHIADTVFIGGGTPSLVPAEMIGRLIGRIRESFDLTEDAEITIESNPNSLTYEKLARYKEYGINRLSMGVQSMDDDILTALGRVHRSADAQRAFRDARRAGFDNINIDLMFGVPHQSIDDVLGSVRMVTGMDAGCEGARKGPEHISFYGLQLEEGTPFYEEYKNGILSVPDDREEREMYHKALRTLKEEGYLHYEISNLCRPGYECRHNSKYWHMGEYLGLGLDAHSYISGMRWKNTADPDEYMDQQYGSARKDAVTADEVLSENPGSAYDSREDEMGIYMFTALRTSKGADLSEFERRFGESFYDVYEDRRDLIRRYIDDGLMVLSGHRLALTEKGIDVSNDIMSEFVF